MKTERRHELATNELADWLGDLIERAKPYSTAITGTVLALIVLLAALAFWSRQSTAKIEEGWDRYFAALDQRDPDSLKNVADAFAATPAGQWSRLSYADSMLEKGVQQLFEDRDAALEALNEAVQSYTSVIEHAAADSLLAERATFGLAESYESLGKISEAREKYQAVRERWPQDVLAEQAADRIADIDRDSTQSFYAWFETEHPTPKTDGGAGKKPPFGLDGLNLDDPSLFESSSSAEKRKEDASPAADSLIGESPLKKALQLPNGKSPKKDGESDEGESDETMADDPGPREEPPAGESPADADSNATNTKGDEGDSDTGSDGDSTDTGSTDTGSAGSDGDGDRDNVDRDNVDRDNVDRDNVDRDNGDRDDDDTAAEE